jgi:hypothetical protein
MRHRCDDADRLPLRTMADNYNVVDESNEANNYLYRSFAF